MTSQAIYPSDSQTKPVFVDLSVGIDEEKLSNYDLSTSWWRGGGGRGGVGVIPEHGPALSFTCQVASCTVGIHTMQKHNKTVISLIRAV